MHQLLRAIEDTKNQEEEEEEKPPTTEGVAAKQEADQSDHAAVEQLTREMEGASISTPARRQSYLHHQPNSISGIGWCLCVCVLVSDAVSLLQMMTMRTRRLVVKTNVPDLLSQSRMTLWVLFLMRTRNDSHSANTILARPSVMQTLPLAW